MKVLEVQSRGRLERRERDIGALSPGLIRVRVKYAGVGFADVMAVRGGYILAPKGPFSPGYEFVGTVESLGAGVSEVVRGQRVAGMLPHMGAYREYLDLDPRWVVEVPDGVGDEVAGLLPLNYLTALALIEKKARLQRGQSFLIHSAAGGVGTAALEIAREWGLRAYGTAASAKHDLIRELGGHPLDGSGDWVRELRSVSPRGVDAAFDPYGDDSLERSWTVLGQGGALVSYSFASGPEGYGYGRLLRNLISLGMKNLWPNGKRATVCGTPALIQKDPDWYRTSLEKVLSWAAAGRCSPVLHGIVPWNEADLAHQAIVDRRVRGKVLLDFSV